MGQYEIFSYGNIDALSGLFNALAALMGSNVFLQAIALVFVVGFMGAFLASALAPDRLVGPKWLMSVILIYAVLFLPKSTVHIVDKVGASPPAVIANVPIGLAMQAGVVSTVGNVLTDLFEQALQVLPQGGLDENLTFQGHGLMFGSKLILESRQVNFSDPNFRADMVNFLASCTVFDVSQGRIDSSVFATSTDIWPLLSNTNKARFSVITTPTGQDSVTCTEAYQNLTDRISPQVTLITEQLGLKVNPGLQQLLGMGASLPGTQAATLLTSQIESAYARANIAGAAADAATILRQNAMVNSLQEASLLGCQQSNDPSCMMLGVGISQAKAQINANFMTSKVLAEEALPLIRNAIEAVLYGIFPFILLLALMMGSLPAFQILKGYGLGLIWIALWPPIYAIINYLGTLAAVKHIAAAGYMGAAGTGLSVSTASVIYGNAISDLAVVGYLTMSVPMIAGALAFGMNKIAGIASGMTSVMGSAAGAAGATAANASVSMGATNFDQYRNAPNYSSAHMSTMSDGFGTTTYQDGKFTAFKQNMSSGAISAKSAEEMATRAGQASSQSQAIATEQAQRASHALDASYTAALANVSASGTGTRGSSGYAKGDEASFQRQFSAVEEATEQFKKDLGIKDSSDARRIMNLSLGLGGSGGSGGKDALATLASMGVGINNQHVSANQFQESVDKARSTLDKAGVSSVDGLLLRYTKSQEFSDLATTSRNEANRIEAGLAQSDSLMKSSSKSLRESNEYRETAENLKSAALRGEVSYANELYGFMEAKGVVGPGKNPSTAEMTASVNEFFHSAAGVAINSEGKPEMMLFNGGNNVTVTPGSNRDLAAQKRKYDETTLTVDGQAQPTTEKSLQDRHANDRNQVKARGTGSSEGIPTKQELKAGHETLKNHAEGQVAVGKQAVGIQQQVAKNDFINAANKGSPSQKLWGGHAGANVGREAAALRSEADAKAKAQER